MALREFRLPDPGEGLTEAEIVTWHVAPGDTVKVNDVVVEIETAKSLVELPVPFAGTVSALLVKEGDTVEVGTPIISIDDRCSPGRPDGPSPDATTPSPGGGAASGEETPDAGAPAAEDIDEGMIGGTTSTGRTAVLVGYGVKQTEAKRRPRSHAAARRPAEPAATRPRRPAPLRAVPGVGTPGRAGRRSPPAGPAKPPVRKLAKDLGVDLGSVTPTGEGGIVTRSDVEAAAAGDATAAGTRRRPPVAAAPAASARPGCRSRVCAR